MKLIINEPHIKNNRLISNIKYGNKQYDMYFEVEKKYTKYLSNTSNAFLVALLPFIIKHEYDVIVKGDISSKLYYQLNNYLIPLLCREFKKKKINIKCNLTNIKYESKGVGASISCGVDSFYTLLKHKNIKDYSITHLTFFNAGSNGENGGEEARKLYYERLKPIKKFCEEQNYELVTVDTNMNELIQMDHEMTHTFRTLSCVFALEKLFGKYYFASGLNFNNSHIDEEDTAYYDILNVHCLSNENIDFYCSGLETTRMEKIKFISQFSETYNWLNVCIMKENNCGHCNKCIRTMTALDSINKLENYKNVFDIEEYKKNKTVILKNLIIGQRDKTAKQFYGEIIESFKENNKKIPFKSYLLAYIPSKQNIKYVIKKIIPKSIMDKIKKPKIKENGWISK
ncbi:MAG: hypothetical protein IJZ36_02675 [Bacilli bacterium]|nr:hypothetical protein [Bacilli bacterium]